MRQLTSVFLLLLLATSVHGAADKELVIDRAATVPLFAQAPVIDGSIEPGEWDRAVRTTGFIDIKPGRQKMLEHRTGTTYVGYTTEKLYIAVVSEMPPDGKLYAKQTNRDSNVVFDESVEIWIDPNRRHRKSGEGDLTFTQFIGNARGTIYDVRFDPSKGSPDIGWNGNWEYENRVDKATHTWTAEIAIPFADFGWKKGTVVGRELGVLVARNFKRGWSQATWFPHQGSFGAWDQYPVLKLTRNAPAVQITGLGEKLHQAQPHVQVRVHNPGPARKAAVRLAITSSDMPGVEDAKTLDLPAQGTADYEFKVGGGRFHLDATHTVALSIRDAAAGETLMGYTARWTQAPEKRWHVRVGPNPAAAVKLAYYPSYSKLKLKIDTTALDEKAEKAREAAVVLTDEDGKVYVNRTLAWEKTATMEELPIPDLPDGEYRVHVALQGTEYDFVRTFKRVRFPWEGNRLGITKKVYPPFKPLAVEDGRVKVVLREYAQSGLGLWQSVTSLGEEVLAAPIALKVDGGTALQGDGAFTKTAGHAVVYEGKASHPAVEVTTKCTTEYDGCMKVELTLAPGAEKQALERLWLEIPVRDAVAPLWHVTTSGLRTNPVGATPPGQGEVWDSTRFPDGNWTGNFKCYFWVGGVEKGICWFADNDRGWVLSKDKQGNYAPCQVLSRSGEVLSLRINLVQEPITLEEPRTITFGLMASPAKPLPKDWRRWIDNGKFGNGIRTQLMGSEYWGADENCSAKYPRNGDFTILDKMHELRLTGDRSTAGHFTKVWCDRNLAGDIAGTSSKTAAQIENLVKVSLSRAALQPVWFSVYWEEFHSTSWHHPETKIFQNEWSGNFGYGSTGGLVPSYQDFACWYGTQFLMRHIGLYFDNAFPKRAYDPLTTNAYVMEDGRIQPSAGMWAHREYLKRIWVLHQQHMADEYKPLMMIHMTNTHLVPCYSFNMSNLDLEWFYGPEPQQSKYPHAMLRAQSTGRQSGNVPYALARVDKTTSPEQKRKANRTRFGVLFVHEIKAYMPSEDGKLMRRVYEFGYGEEDCQVYNYWQENGPVTASDPECKSILLVRGTEALLVLVTWNKDPATVSVEVDEKALGFVPAAVKDEETGAALPNDGAGFRIALDGYAVRMLRLSK